MTDEFIGKTIDGYEVVSRSGHGGMATVYRARQKSMNDRIVALKILPRHFMRDETYLQRFRREVEIVARLEHRNIVPVYSYGEYDGQPYIAMRYMSGGSVDDLLNLASDALEIDRIVDILTQIAPALDFAHQKNILHRDLKPSNVLLDDDGGAYITDFGIARITGGENQGATITTQGVVGTPAYMSPEQAKGEDLDGRSDVYAMGVMLFEMATGRRPFVNDTPYGIAVMQVTTPPPTPRAINPRLTGAVESVILKSLKKGRDNRYQTAVQLAASLKMAVERPDTFHDTQPRPLPIKEALELTQQSRTQPHSYLDEKTEESSSKRDQAPAGGAASSSAPSSGQMLQHQPRVPTPAPPNTHPGTPPPMYTPQPAMRPVSQPLRPKRRSGNMWIGIVLGGLIGCALLAVVVTGGAIAVGNLLGGSDSDPPTTAPEQESDTGGITIPGIASLDATSIAARDERLSDAPTPTPAPVGVRDSYADTGVILYFDERPLTEGTESMDIFRTDLTTGIETRLTRHAATDSYPVSSPDGERIAFQSNRDGDFEIYVMDSDGFNVEKLTSNDHRDRLPAWSPDGNWIIYSSDTRGDGTLDLYRVSPDGGRPEQLLSNGRRNSHPRYSPDGRYIVFTTGDAQDATNWDIARFDTQTEDVVLLVEATGRDASPSYSPDASTVLYTTGGSANGNTALAVVPADGGTSVRLYETNGGYIWGGYYSPDGAWITFDVQTGTDSALFMMRADGSDLREVDAVNGGAYPSWLP